MPPGQLPTRQRPPVAPQRGRQAGGAGHASPLQLTPQQQHCLQSQQRHRMYRLHASGLQFARCRPSIGEKRRRRGAAAGKRMPPRKHAAQVSWTAAATAPPHRYAARATPAARPCSPSPRMSPPRFSQHYAFAYAMPLFIEPHTRPLSPLRLPNAFSPAGRLHAVVRRRAVRSRAPA